MALINQTIEDFIVAHRQWENYRQYLENDHAELIAWINQLEGKLQVEQQTNANHICTIKWMAHNILQLDWSTTKLQVNNQWWAQPQAIQPRGSTLATYGHIV